MKSQILVLICLSDWHRALFTSMAALNETTEDMSNCNSEWHAQKFLYRLQQKIIPLSLSLNDLEQECRDQISKYKTTLFSSYAGNAELKMTHQSLLRMFSMGTIRCRYNAVQYDMILHIAQQSLKPSIYHS